MNRAVEKESHPSLISSSPDILQIEPGINMDALIGVPHLFGRYHETREGFMIVPLGNMTLQADGRVTGYSHPNEDSWVPYPHGNVAANKAFAFMTKDNA